MKNDVGLLSSLNLETSIDKATNQKYNSSGTIHENKIITTFINLLRKMFKMVT